MEISLAEFDSERYEKAKTDVETAFRNLLRAEREIFGSVVLDKKMLAAMADLTTTRASLQDFFEKVDKLAFRTTGEE
jgi:hypothetical protein